MNNKEKQVSVSHMSGATVSAVAIFAGFMDAGIKHMGGITPGTANEVWHPLDLYKKEIAGDSYGCDSVYGMLASWAGMVQELWEGVHAAGECGAPGVFDYEVSEEFGGWFWRHSFETRSEPEHDACSLELGRLCWDFFNRDEGGDSINNPHRFPATADAIARITGYREHAAPVKEAKPAPTLADTLAQLHIELSELLDAARLSESDFAISDLRGLIARVETAQALAR